ncbi:fibronectin type III domain-containing protein [Priestia aryabhattai]
MTCIVSLNRKRKVYTKLLKKKYVITTMLTLFILFPAIGVEAEGNGTTDDPYLISNCIELQNITNHLESSYKLTSDIDCSLQSSFEPLSELPNTMFSGSFDGNNFEIKNLTINQPSKSASLFGAISGKVSDLRIESAKIYGYNLSGPLATLVSASGIIDNVVASGEVKSPSVHSGMVVNNQGVIKNSRAYLNLESSGYIGGIAAVNNGIITDSYSNSQTNQLGTTSQGNGGLVGYNSSAGTILNSYSRSIIKGVGTETGGVVGLNYGTVRNSYSNSQITVSGGYAGGFSGSSVGLIDSSFAKGTITNTGSTSKCTSGFTADLLSTTTLTGAIKNSFSHTTVTSSGDRVSSFVGCLEKNGADPTILNSYAVGKVIASGTTKGGLVGYRKTSTGIVTNSFWDTNTTGMSTSPMGTAKTSTQMKTEATYTSAGWNLTDLWNISNGFNSGYPYFKGKLMDVPTFPSNFSVAGKTDREISLSWDYNNKADDYEIWKDGILIRQEPKTAFNVTDLTPNTAYQFKLIARNIEGNSPPSIINVKTRISKPTGISLEKSDSKILVKWDHSSDLDVTGYNLYCNDIKVNGEPISKDNAEYTVNNLTNYQSYKFTVSAIDKTGEESVISNAVYGNPVDLTPPNKVDYVTSTSNQNSIKLSWINPEDDFNSVLIYRDGQLTTETTNDFFIDSNLESSVNYNYKFVVRDPHGNLSEETIYKGRTKPEVPLQLSAEPDDKSVLVKWTFNDPLKVSGFNVYVNGEKVNQHIVPNSTREYLVTNLHNNKPYQFTVTSIDEESESTFSNVVSTTPVDKISPDIVKKVRYENTDKVIKLEWEHPVDDFAAVLIYRDDNLIAETAGNNYTDLNLDSSRLYRYKLVTKDESGNLSIPFVANVSTKPKIPLDLTGVLVKNGINLSWSNNTENNIKGYNVYLNSKKWNSAPIEQNNERIPLLLSNISSTYTVEITAVNKSGIESDKTRPLLFSTTPSINPTPLVPATPSIEDPEVKETEKTTILPVVPTNTNLFKLSKKPMLASKPLYHIKESAVSSVKEMKERVCIRIEDISTKCKKTSTDIFVSNLDISEDRFMLNISSNKPGTLKIKGTGDYTYNFDGKVPFKLNETKLMPNKKYTVSITILDHTEEFSIYTLAKKPTNLDVKIKAANVIEIQWDNNNNPPGTKYNLYVNNNLYEKSLKTTFYVFKDFKRNKDYKIAVVAVNRENKATEPIEYIFKTNYKEPNKLKDVPIKYLLLIGFVLLIIIICTLAKVLPLFKRNLFKKKRP